MSRSDRGWVVAFGFSLSVCLFSACIHTAKTRYLSATEIQAWIIGSSLKEAGEGSWQEVYLPSEGDNLQGTLRGRSKFRLPYSGTWSIDGDLMCVEYPTIPDQGGCYRFSRRNGNKILWFDEAGSLADESELIERDGVEDADVELASPAFRQETVTFRHGQDSLVGDLSLPAHPPPYPVILFVHGSGPTTRHWSFYEPMRNEFIRRGFATLIWSKPGVDESTGDYLTQSMAQRAEEVEAAMTQIAERSDIDPDRIGLWGVSQAGWVVPIVAGHRDVAFVIMMSCPAQTALNQELYMADNLLLASIETSEIDRADALDKVRAYDELIRTSSSYEDFLSGLELLLAVVKERSWYAEIQRHPIYSQISWFQPIDRELYGYRRIVLDNDAPPKLENLQSPLLAIYGTRDVQVDWKLGSKAYEVIPRAAGNSDVTVKLFDGANHTLIAPDDEGYLDFAPGFLTTMGEWLAEHR